MSRAERRAIELFSALSMALKEKTMTEEKKEKKPRGPRKTFEDTVRVARDGQAKLVEKLGQRAMAKREELIGAEAALDGALKELARMNAMLSANVPMTLSNTDPTDRAKVLAGSGGSAVKP